jgi:hypothetical protein
MIATRAETAVSLLMIDADTTDLQRFYRWAVFATKGVDLASH